MSERSASRPLLELRDLRKHFTSRPRPFSSPRVVRAVDGISLSVEAGETLGLVGESGCGKSTLARTILLLETPTSGEIRFKGRPLTVDQAERLRRQAQIVLQDPYTSLPPSMRVRRILAEPLLIHRVVHRASIADRVDELIRSVGLKPEVADQLPHQLSGGQRQRVNVARALAVEPDLIVADEAVSSLDVSVQAQILNLLRELQEQHALTYLFISHDLGVVKYMSHRIAVMYLGEIVELSRADELYDRPLHPYTRALLSAVPSIRRRQQRRIRLEGEPPDPGNPPSGCRFHPRCPLAQPICQHEQPGLDERLPGQRAACHFALCETPAEAARAAQDMEKR